jgi:Carboxypeptidase regulatory-like domain
MQNENRKNRMRSVPTNPGDRREAESQASCCDYFSNRLAICQDISLWRSSAPFSLLMVVLLLSFGLPAVAQYTSNAQGTVFDPSSRAIAGAEVTLTNNANGLISNTQTNDSGLYHFENVPPGNYTITVAANGFQKTEVSAVLTADSTTGINVTLQVGKENSSITVNAVSTSLNPDETRLQATLEASTIANLPLQNNSVYSTIAATPGVTGYNDSRFTDNFTNEHTIEANANGTYYGGNNYVLDGVVVDSNIITGEVNISPNPDSLQEVTMQTNTFSAQYGGASSVVTEMASKSGTNTLHGSANYLFTNQDLAAGTEFVHTYSPFKRHDLTAALGGPIVKDRTFLFASGEMKRSSEQGLVSGNGETGSVGLVNYPDPAFVAWSQATYPNSHGTYIMTQYPATDVKLRSIVEWADPTYSTFCFTPTPSCGSPFLDNGIPTATPYDNGLQLNIRGDQFFRQGKDKIFINSYRTKDDFTADDIRPAFDVPAFTLNWYENATYSHVFNPNFMNIARMSAFAAEGRQNSNNLSGSAGAPLSKLPYLSTNAEGVSFGGNAWGPATFIQHNYDFNDLITYIRGRHAFKIGFDYYHGDDSADFSAPRERPTYTFANLPAFAADQVFEESGVTFDPLTGQFSPNKFGDQNARVGAFIQDEWKATPTLLLSLGLRWDDMGNATPYGYPKLYPQIDNLHLGTGSFDNMFATAVMRGAQHVFNHGEDNNWSPRFGFAWSPRANLGWTIRGGVGLYRTTVTLGQTIDSLDLNPPNWVTPAFGVQETIQAIYSYGTSTTNPYGFVYPAFPANTLNAAGGLTGVASAVNGVDPNIHIAKTVLYQLATEKQLRGNIVVGLNYSGSAGIGLFSGNEDYNRFAGDLAENNGILTRLNPNFGSMGFVWNTNNSNYNAMIATIRQSFHSGLNWQASYDWSHVLDDGTCSTRFDYNSNLDCAPDQHHMLHATSPFDVKSRFTISGVYNFPSPRINHLSEVLGGWAISTLAIAQSGEPFTAINTSSYCVPPAGTEWGPANPYPNSCGDYNEDGFNLDYPNLGSAKPGGFARHTFLKGVFPSGAFTTPTLGTEGNEGRDIFRGPGLVNADANLIKNFALPWFHSEHSTLQLRGSFYNVFNRANLSNVDTGVTDATFGQATNTLQPRIIQLVGRFQF